jgi:hypothetical protein
MKLLAEVIYSKTLWGCLQRGSSCSACPDKADCGPYVAAYANELCKVGPVITVISPMTNAMLAALKKEELR